VSAATCLWPAGALLGEGPLWSADEGVLYWVDIKQPRVFRYHLENGEREVFPMPEEIGCLGLVEGGGLIAGLRSGFVFLDLELGGARPIVDPERDLPGNRFNDGKCDSAGRFWAGTMDDGEREPSGALYRLNHDLSVERMDAGYVITNGPAWSPDGGILYHVDTLQRLILAFDCDPATGALGDRKTFAEIPEELGYPDGLTVDAEGGVWCALWGGSQVRRFTPGGEFDRALELPASQVTSCTFGGADLRTLFVTTASIGLTSEQLSAQPEAGGLFALDPEVRGLRTPTFAPLNQLAEEDTP